MISEIENCLVMDPGGRHFAITLMRKGIPVWMGYHPAIEHFDINDLFYYKLYLDASDKIIKRGNGLLIERYITRQAAKKVSPERMNIMIGTMLTLSHINHSFTQAVTSSYWKRQLFYDECIEDAAIAGYLKKDKHFIDTILMYSVVCGLTEEEAMKKVIDGLPAYKRLKEKEKLKKEKEKERQK